MSSGKGKKFAKGKTMDLNTFISDLTPGAGPNVDWAEMMEDNASAPIELKTEIMSARKQLPSAPRNVREAAEVDLSQVPTQPPFEAFVNNIPFTSTQQDVYDMLRSSCEGEVKDIRLMPDKLRGRGHQGRGIVEFTSREGLINALKLTDSQMRDRTVKISVHIDTRQHQQQQQQQHGYEQQRPDDNYYYHDNRGPPAHNDVRYSQGQNDAFSSFTSRRRQQHYDDRRGPSQQHQQYDRQQGYNNYQQRDYGHSQQQQHYYGGGYQERHGDYGGQQRGHGGGHDYYHQSQHQQQPNYNNYGYQQQGRGPAARQQYSSHGDYRNGGDYSHSRSHYQQQPHPQQQYSAPPAPRQRNDSHMSQSATESLTERPKLKIQPRSKPSVDEDADAPAPQRNSSIFGGAKPVDTTKKDLEIQEKERMEREKLTDHGGRGGPPGAALRIDTQRRTSERTLSQSSSGAPAQALRSPKSPVSSESVRLAPQVPQGQTGKQPQQQPHPEPPNAWHNRGGGNGAAHRGGQGNRGGYPPREFHRGGNRGAGQRGGYSYGGQRGGGYNEGRGRGGRGSQPYRGNVAPRHARGGGRGPRQSGAREMTDEEFEQVGQEQEQQVVEETQPEEVAVEPAAANPDDAEPVDFTSANRFGNLSMEDDHE